MQEAVAKTGRYDVMMPTAMSYPDWIDSGVIYDLTDWTEKYDPELFNKDYGVVFPASHHAQLYNGRVAGLLNDGDQITLLCRKDYLEGFRQGQGVRGQVSAASWPCPTPGRSTIDLALLHARPGQRVSTAVPGIPLARTTSSGCSCSASCPRACSTSTAR